METKTPENRKPGRSVPAAALALLLALTLALAGCAKAPAEANGTDAKAGQPLRVVCTIFPAYDWMRNVLGDNPAGVDLTLLMDTGVDLHSYQPAAKDILTVANADLFVYVGGESDEWAEDALETAPNASRVALSLIETLGSGAKEEEIVEGMQDDHDHDADDHDHDHEEPEYDEHVWLSLRNAALFADAFAGALGKLDPENAAVYASNAAAYRAELSALDKRYGEAVSAGRVSTVLFADRFPFRYLTDDYGLAYYAAFVGCSAETEASFETVAFLARKVDELGLSTVLTIEGAAHPIAETVVRSTVSKNQTIRTLDSMQSVTKKDAEGGATYLSIMEANLAVLAEALR